MRFILLFFLLPFFLYANEHRILFSGFTVHERSKDRFNLPYNEFNYGIGYEYNFFTDYNSLYFGANVLLLQDSFDNPQLTIGAGHAYRFHTDFADISAGINGFVGLKKIYTDKDSSRDGGSYKLTGGIAPGLNLYYKDFSLNLIYVPSIEFKEVDITGYLYIYFSYRL